MPRRLGSHIMPLEQRFMRHVYADPNTGCWLWGGANDGKHGSGSFVNDNGVQVKAHRASHELFKGPIPCGHEIDHKCNFPPCVNPGHLEAVTRQENMRRASKIGLTFGGPANGRRQQAKTHCPHGHEYSQTASITPQGWRRCKACNRDREAARRANFKTTK
jgi:hypothetical protein